MFLASGGQTPEVVPNTLRCTGEAPGEQLSSSSVRSAEVERQSLV